MLPLSHQDSNLLRQAAFPPRPFRHCGVTGWQQCQTVPLPPLQQRTTHTHTHTYTHARTAKFSCLLSVPASGDRHAHMRVRQTIISHIPKPSAWTLQSGSAALTVSWIWAIPRNRNSEMYPPVHRQRFKDTSSLLVTAPVKRKDRVSSYLAKLSHQLRMVGHNVTCSRY